jgi:DNA polymerase-3 subunit epsilon
MTINRALIIDTETTGSDTSKDRVIEIGAVLYSVTAQSTLFQLSALYSAESNPAEHINGISMAAIAAAMEVTFDARRLLLDMFTASDVVVCHNGLDFDRVFLGPPFDTKPWLDTKRDFCWPKGRPGMSLVDLALCHGIGVASAHRALTDCQLIAALFDRMTDLQGMFAVAMRPKAMFRALVEYDDRQLAKDAGFQWDPTRKIWTRSMAIDDAKALPFLVKELA